MKIRRYEILNRQGKSDGEIYTYCVSCARKVRHGLNKIDCQLICNFDDGYKVKECIGCRRKA